MATGENTYMDSHGNAVDVDLTATVLNEQVAYVQGWLGIAAASGDSGDRIALNLDPHIYQFTVPSGLGASKGDIVYITVATVTGHTPDDAAYSTSAGAGKIALLKATEDQDGTLLVGKLLSGFGFVS